MLGLIGLGRMGLSMAKRWRARSLPVVGYDPDLEAQARARKEGIRVASSLADLAGQLTSPKTFWLMVPAGAVDSVLEGLAPYLSPEDLVVDGGNSFYRESQRRGEALAQKGVGFVDVGVSGGLWG
ncbi:6-phosphogluconate dehydrogenase, partial [Thermus scotoductus]